VEVFRWKQLPGRSVQPSLIRAAVKDYLQHMRQLTPAQRAEELGVMLRHIADSIESALANVPQGVFPCLNQEVCDQVRAVASLLCGGFINIEHPEVVALQVDPKTADVLEAMRRGFAGMSKYIKERMDKGAEDTSQEMAGMRKDVNDRLDKSAEDTHHDLAAASKDVNERLEKSAQDTHREIVSVSKDFNEMRKIKERLVQMQAEKLFKFANQIRPADFRAFCAILAEGNVAKAARAMNEAVEKVRSRLRRWKKRGPAYKVLLEFVRWRKQIGQKGTVPMPESLLKNTASHTDYPGILSDILEEVLAMTEDNWQEKAEALTELLRPYVPR
jgi:hypothetical protein